MTKTYYSLVASILLSSFTLSCVNSGDSESRNYESNSPVDLESLTPVEHQIVTAEWNVIELSEDVSWRYFHFDSLFDAKQFVTFIEVNLNGNVKIDIPFVTEGFGKTSEMANNIDALAAVNGSFFDTKVGGSTVFFRKDGEVVNLSRDGFNPFRENAGFVVGEAGNVSIVSRPSEEDGGWKSVEAEHLLTSGPLLIYEDIQLSQEDNPFNNNRHPRTAAGITRDNHLILLVVDGRSSESYGMSIAELAEVMNALDCVDAMNLDGGGSSTAWVNEEGVVNHPSDNKLFDNKGERGVANAIVVR